jgi:uncharacterized protein
MSKHFGSLVFTPVVKALQEKHGSRRQYARLEETGRPPDRLESDEVLFISERDTFYMASVGSTGWPYVQHRGGPKGFLKVIDGQTLAFADFRGNSQYVSTGNLSTDDRVALILMDYPHQARLKVLGHVSIFEGEAAKDWIDKVRHSGYKAMIERVYVIRVQAFDWNCSQHITPRYTVDEIREVLAPFEARMKSLEEENEELRNKRQ